MKISVSILNEINNYKEAIKKVNESKSDYIHLDIMDSSFTEKSSFIIDDFKNIEFDKKADVHLMSNNLDKLIDEYSLLNPEIISFHYEVGNTKKYIEKIKEKGIKVGLAINPDTDLNEVKDYLNDIDILLIMSVIPGKGGQSYISSVTNKIKEAKKLQKEYRFLIEVDGGINDKTIKEISDFADIFVSGSYITNSSNYNEKIDNLKKC